MHWGLLIIDSSARPRDSRVCKAVTWFQIYGFIALHQCHATVHLQPIIPHSGTTMHGTDTCTDACLGTRTHLQVDCRWRGVSEQQHHEEEWVRSREDVPLVCQNNHGSSCKAHTASASTTLTFAINWVALHLCIREDCTFPTCCCRCELETNATCIVADQPLQLLINSNTLHV